MRRGMNFANLNIRLFNLKHTFESAQPLAFYADYNEVANSLTYPSGGHVINIRRVKESDSLFVTSNNMDYAVKEVRERFRLDDRMNFIYKQINTDNFMDSAIKNFRGLRLTLNDPWEATLVFILSQFNNVKRIRKTTKSMIEKYGERISGEYDNKIKDFPESERIADASEKDLVKCGAGFRAKYIRDAAEFCTYNINLESLKGKKYDEIKETLLEIKGVGDKVADCIALMGFGKLEAFPIDRWVKRTMERVYFKGKETSIKKIAEFASERWGDYAGYAQQYIFWNGRTEG
ncbi:8-oxoguanine DNA glycosylase [Candidatus Marsarchaeota archaeon]|nr:8-oxoguanine DNA glycosylase [Candidatus Marsarchaeota archaeon]